jgi:hypothetical protein
MQVSSAFDDHVEGLFQVESKTQEFALPSFIGGKEERGFDGFTEGLEDPHE